MLGHQSRLLCPRVPVNGHLPALSSVFASMFFSDRVLHVFFDVFHIAGYDQWRAARPAPS